MTTTTIEISTELDGYIRSKGQFGDDYESVLRRELGMDQKTANSAEKTPANHEPTPTPPGRKYTRAAYGSVTQEDAYRPHIIAVLLEAEGHQMPCRDVINKVYVRMRGQLTPVDVRVLKSGDARWSNKCQWARKALVDDGILEPSHIAGRGVWRLTKKFLAEAQDYCTDTQ